MSDTTTRTLPCFSATSSLVSQSPVLVIHRFNLRVLSGPDRGAECSVRAAAAHVGSAAGNELQVADPAMSRHHFEIVVREGRPIVRDLGSTNGTYLDGVRIVEAYLPPRAKLRAGDTELTFEIERETLDLDTSEMSNFGELVTVDPTMKSVLGILATVANTDLTCLLWGQSGTGKELAARALHEEGTRSDRPFVVVDCATLQRELVEDELFGHERGAFTGADRARPGAFEEASTGTVFLDEIGELPLELQPRLLRVLERREVTRLGSSKVLDVDVRVVAATHRDLRTMVAAGRFREDLFHRLGEMIVQIPPLSERPGDIELLAQRFLAAQGHTAGLTKAAARALEHRAWRGNARELRNWMKRAAAFAGNSAVDVELLDRLDVGGVTNVLGTSEPGVVPIDAQLPIREARQRWLDKLEREYLLQVLTAVGGDLDAVADHIELSRKSVFRLLRQHGLMDESGKVSLP